MATLDTTPVRELSDTELRKRLLSLGYDVPVSVNREFLVRKLENASAGGGGRSNKRHSMATPASSTPERSGSPNSVRKRKSVAATPTRGHSNHHNNVSVSTPISPLATSSPMSPGTPQQQYMGSPASTMSMNTPSTPSPFVSRLSTPSPNSSPRLNNGEAGSHSPRYLDYYNYFKNSPGGGGGGDSGVSGDLGGGAGYAYAYSRGRMSSPGSFNPVTSVAPPSRSERNGYSTAGGTGGTSLGVETDWFGSHFISKILVIAFVLFFAVIGGIYMSKNMGVDPRGLTSDGSTVPKQPQQQQVPPTPPPPPKKKVEAPLPPTSMNYPVCGLKGVDPEACIPKEVVKNSRTLFNALKDELTQRARRMGCQSGIEETISLNKAKGLLYTLTSLHKPDVDSAFIGMLILVNENPRAGLSLHGPEENISSKDMDSLDFDLAKISATGINPDFICGIKAMCFSLVLYVAIAITVAGTGYGGWKGYKLFKSRKEREQEEIFKMIERVVELLYAQHELCENSQGGTPFLAVNHVRDELVPTRDRLKKEAFWNSVVNYISNHESRVREEIQHISGEEFKVWRWLPSASPLASKRFSASANSHRQKSRFSMPSSPLISASSAVPSTSAGPVAGPSHANMSPPPAPQPHNLYPNLSGMDDDDDGPVGGAGDTNNKWQGQAFETCEGSPNALPNTPTTCLKIRHMFTERDGIQERTRIEKSILEKCYQARILHIGIDASSSEGCVYIRCLTKDDARNAFMALHGWWFEGKLLSVKFLREERYFSRFPEAKNCKAPMGLSR